MNRTEYLEDLTGQIRNKHAKELVREEMTAHIEDQKEAYLLVGNTAEEAEILAVKEMGDPVDTGVKLDKIHRPKTDIFMLAVMALLTLTGIVMQMILFSHSGSALIAAQYPVRTLLYNFAGFAVMAFVYFRDYRVLAKYIWPVYGVYLLGAAVLPNIPPYLYKYGYRLPLSQSIPVLYVPLFAVFCYHFRGQKGKGIAKGLGLLFLNTFLLWLISSSLFGTAASLGMFFSFTACMATLCAAAFKGIFGGRRKLQTGLLIAFMAGMPALLLGDIMLLHGRFLTLADYQIRRIQAMIDPAAFAQGEAYQTLLIREQLGNAPILGGGKLIELPGAWSNYVLTGLASYFGLLLAFAVVALIAAWLLRSFCISFLQHNRLSFLLGVSCSSILMLKTAAYVAMNFGVGPALGVDMPFFTYGLHCTLVNFLFAGIILAVYRNTNLLPEYKEAPVRYRLRIERAAGK